MVNKGFTLIELLVVISIIASLSSIVLAVVNEGRSKAQYTSLLSSIKSFQTEAEIIWTNNRGFYNSMQEGQEVYEDCISEGISFFESTENNYVNIMKLADVKRGEDVFCYVGKDSYAIAFRLGSKFQKLFSNQRTVCFDSAGNFFRNNENVSDMISNNLCNN